MGAWCVGGVWQALARLHFLTEVTEEHVREAVRLVESSKVGDSQLPHLLLWLCLLGSFPVS